MPDPYDPKEDAEHIVMAGIRLPRPTGENCPDHPTYPLVWKDGKPWCRRGDHYVEAVDA